MNFSTSLLLILAFIAANLPFFVERVFFIIPPKEVNFPLGWMLFSFKGRLARPPYWILTLVVIFVWSFLSLTIDRSVLARSVLASLAILPLAIITLWIFFAVQVKRLHDRNISGRWALLYFIPGALLLAILNGLFAGTTLENRFGGSLKSGAVAKGLFWRFLELVVMFFVVGGIAMLLEGKLGDIHRQKWEFYAITAPLFVVFAYPGFVYRYLWRRRGV